MLGMKGGYYLAKPAESIRLLEIISVLEEDISFVSCVKNRKKCKEVNECVARNLWVRLNRAVEDVLYETTLADIAFSSPDSELE